MSYKWAQGAVVRVKAEVAAAEILRINEQRNGEFRAEHLVAESRPSSAPLHECFEWDNETAADNWRRNQAQYIVRNIIMRDDDTGRECRVFVNVRPGEASLEERVYVTAVDAMANPVYRAQILQAALKEIESWRKRYGEYAELAAIVSAVEQTRQELASTAV